MMNKPMPSWIMSTVARGAFSRRQFRRRRFLAARCVVAAFVGSWFMLCIAARAYAERQIELQRDDRASTLTVEIDGREAVVYRFGPDDAFPHYWPIRSPSGKALTLQHPDPYPYHRSAWVADKVSVAGGPSVDFYHCWSNYRTPDDPRSGWRHFIRHQKFDELKTDGAQAIVRSTSHWVVNESRSILTETRNLRVVALAQGEYLLDWSWTLTPNESPVRFESDAVHYAWPYVRMAPEFSVEHGGTLRDDAGQSQWKRHAPERHPAILAEIGGCLLEASVEAFES